MLNDILELETVRHGLLRVALGLLLALDRILAFERRRIARRLGRATARVEVTRSPRVFLLRLGFIFNDNLGFNDRN